MERTLQGSPFLRTLAEADEKSVAGDWDAAAQWWERIITANPVEGHFWSRLAEARYQTNAYPSAAKAYEHAYTLRDGFPAETAFQLTCCYAHLDELPTARDWLQRALDLGLRNLTQFQTDDALACLREDREIRDPAFEAILVCDEHVSSS